MREGRRRPSLGAVPVLVFHQPPAAMREGRRRPSLERPLRNNELVGIAAMREGRRRPSLEPQRPDNRGIQGGRNEGGAPAPLVAGGYPDRPPT